MLDLEKKLDVWRSRYGDLYHVTVESRRYIFRALSIRDCEYIQACLKGGWHNRLDEYVRENVILHPKNPDLDNIPAGEVEVLINAIGTSAGIFLNSDFNEILRRTKQYIEDVYDTDFFQWKLLIVRTLPGYTFSVLDNMSPEEFFRVVRICERVHEAEFINDSSVENPEINTATAHENVAKHLSGNFLSKDEFQAIAADESAQRLRDEYLKQKNKDVSP